jgi:urea transport system ATP-binding protein
MWRVIGGIGGARRSVKGGHRTRGWQPIEHGRRHPTGCSRPRARVESSLVGPRGGRILFDGQDITKLAPYQRVRLGIGYVPQGRDIFNRLTVEENLMMGLAPKSGAAGRKVPEQILELFPVLKQMLKRRGGDLSGGQQQQLAIGRALAADPRLLILDEPTEGIQPSIIKDIGRVIRMLADRGTMAIVLVEQYYDFAAELADQYLVMERGEIVLRGRGKDMAADGARERMAI